MSKKSRISSINSRKSKKISWSRLNRKTVTINSIRRRWSSRENAESRLNRRNE